MADHGYSALKNDMLVNNVDNTDSNLIPTVGTSLSIPLSSAPVSQLAGKFPLD